MKGTESSDESSNMEKFRKKSEDSVLNLRGKGLQSMTSLPKRYSICDLILDNNSITKIEKLDTFPKLCSLSMKNNHLVRMNGVNFGKNLISVNLSNNRIVSMEGLCWLVHLEYLDLSKNNIKRIQNVSYCTKLKHMDLSENSITDISNLKTLVQLKVLLLHGNTITTLARAEENLPEQIETLSLSENGISDLNEVRYLSCLLNLKHFSILDNPCVMTTTSLPGFNFRPFVLCCLMSLVTLDRSAVNDNERQDAERLTRDENLPLFSFGHHLQLVFFLSKKCPDDNTTEVITLNKDHNDLLENFLKKQRAEIFTDEKSAGVTRSVLAMNNSLQSSSYSVLDFSENTQNGSGNFSPDEDSDIDTLRSESRFLPVYSPLKKSPGTDHSRFQRSLSWNASSSGNIEDLPILTDDTANMSNGLPIMTEEEANKLIQLAATILQSHIRGFLVRRKFDYKIFKRRHTAASRIQACWRGLYFRRYSIQGLNFKNELRVRRLQKYISTLCLMMQKSAKQHQVEKQQMLEIITLLYEKFTNLSDKVEELESSTNEGIKFERTDQDESRNLEGTLHPVFSPHPRLMKNIEQSENIFVDTFQNTSIISRGFPSSEDVGYCVKEDMDSVDIIEDVVEEDILEKREALMDKDDHSGSTEWDKKVQNEAENMEKEGEVMGQKDDPHLTELDRQSVTSEDSEDKIDTEKDKDNYSSHVTNWNDEQKDTNKDDYVFETSEAPYNELSTNYPTVQNDEAREIWETFPNIQELEHYKTKDGDLIHEIIDNNKVESENEDDHEDDQKMKKDMITGEEDNLENVIAEVDGQDTEHVKISVEVAKFTVAESRVAEYDALKPTNVNDEVAKDGENSPECGEHSIECGEHSAESGEHSAESGEHSAESGEDSVQCKEDSAEHGTSSAEHGTSVAEYGESLADVVEENQLLDSLKQKTTGSNENISEDKKDYYPNEGQFSEGSIEKRSSENEATTESDSNDKEKHLKVEEFVTFHDEVDIKTEETEHSELGAAEETRVNLGEESEPSEGQCVVSVDDNSMGDCLKDSLDPNHSCSHEIKNVECMEDAEKSTAGEFDGNSVMVNQVSNSESCGGIQNGEPEGPESNSINVESTNNETSYSNEEPSFGGLLEESVTENETVKISPRASSLLSALKDEITGSKDIHPKESFLSSPPASHISDGDVSDSSDVEPDTASDLSTFESQKGKNADDNL